MIVFSLTRTFPVFIFSLLALLSVKAQRSVRFESELNRLFDLSKLHEYTDGSVVRQISSR